MDRFVSYYNYIRWTAVQWGQVIYQNHFQRHYKSLQEWREQDLNECIINQAYECRLDSDAARKMYLTMVRRECIV